MNPRFLTRRLTSFATLLLLGSCTVYAPMQPTISTIHVKGQVEISGGVQASGRVESSVVYSPLPNVLVMGAGTFRPNLGDSTFYQTRQWEAGLGGYLPLGSGWQLTGLAGYGTAHTHRAYVEEPLIWGERMLETYQMRYRKVFGQASLTHEDSRGAVGAVYRLSHLGFDQIDYSAEHFPAYGLPLRSLVRHEALVFGRRNLGAGGRWQLQGTLGLSMAGQGRHSTSEDARYNQVNQVLLPVPTVGLGVVFRPTLRREK
ncbi:hypothetical protein [Hymenobacter persicinus]|uniref:DUF3575 domain-containing protein n=1 Tax=Hymenobacter persicinus TaxID=2025506 RepID=A0A4V1ZAZ8_9BACT|nr:hypothetical protein [Hymenobacter persicinus]RYU81550.1 hypothetical protein EWM57_06015 [Hymenobacter persicinus]